MGAGGDGAGALALVVLGVAIYRSEILEPREIALQRGELGLVDLGLDGLEQGSLAAAPDLGEDAGDLPGLAHLEGGEGAPQRHHGAAEGVVVERLDERAHGRPQRLLRQEGVPVPRRQPLEEAGALARIGAGREALGDAAVEHRVGEQAALEEQRAGHAGDVGARELVVGDGVERACPALGIDVRRLLVAEQHHGLEVRQPLSHAARRVLRAARGLGRHQRPAQEELRHQRAQRRHVEAAHVAIARQVTELDGGGGDPGEIAVVDREALHPAEGREHGVGQIALHRSPRELGRLAHGGDRIDPLLELADRRDLDGVAAQRVLDQRDLALGRPARLPHLLVGALGAIVVAGGVLGEADAEQVEPVEEHRSAPVAEGRVGALGEAILPQIRATPCWSRP